MKQYRLSTRCRAALAVQGLLGVLMGIAAAERAAAAISQFENLATWSVAAGPRNITENFNSFVVDTSFRLADGPLALSSFTLAETGTQSELDSNLIDVLPHVFSVHDVNGTPLAQSATNFGSTFVELRFNTPARAFGAEFRGVNGDEQLNIDAYSAANVLLGTLNPTADNTFLGFVATAGEQVKYLRFRASVNDPFGAREAFAFDNVEIASIPEPASIAMLLVFGALVCGGRRARP